MSSYKLVVKKDLWGDPYEERSSGLSAGAAASKTGNDFEHRVESRLFSEANILVPRNIKNKVIKPKYTNYCGVRNKRGDMILPHPNGVDYHIECKMLGDCSSHMEKLGYIYINLLMKCYKKPFVLVYACNSNIPSSKMLEVKITLNAIAEVGGLVYEINDFIEWSGNKKRVDNDPFFIV